jgi:hypothetical protein
MLKPKEVAMLDWILGYWYCEQYDFVNKKCKKWIEK